MTGSAFQALDVLPLVYIIIQGEVRRGNRHAIFAHRRLADFLKNDDSVREVLTFWPSQSRPKSSGFLDRFLIDF